MCGILGQFLSRNVSLSRFEKALSGLSDRGPDGNGLWLSESQNVALGHARLATRDLNQGQQPLLFSPRDLALVINGELYDLDSIKAHLKHRGYTFQTQSDSEVVLYLYAEYGLECVKFLRGEFALILWDGQSQTGIAIRDRFGIKPLYYHQSDCGLFLASRPSALFDLGVKPGWDYETLAQISLFQYPLPAQSLFNQVESLPPGHILRWHKGETQVFSYWDLDYPLAQDLIQAPSTALREAIATTLQDSVKMRLEADVPIGSYLSGGLDSSLITALINRDQNRPAYCLGFPGWTSDEAPLASVTASALGIYLQLLNLDQNALLYAFPESVKATENVAINPHVAARQLLARKIRADGIKVVLTGEGADELFGGYAHFMQDLYPGNQRQTGLAGMHLPLGECADLSLLQSEWGFVPTFLKAKASLGLRLRSLFSADFCQRYSNLSIQAHLCDSIAATALNHRHEIHRSMYLWCKLGLAGYILPTVGDGAEMAEGLEGRLPFLDHLLFQKVRQLAPTFLMQAGIEKAFLRQIASEFLPESVLLRPKAPFLAPSLITVLLQANPAKGAELQALLFPEPLPDFVDRKALTKRLQWLAQAAPHEHQAWEPPLLLLASLCSLNQTLNKRRTC
jgi:asparagine synthase (glutamine-hydrolysing)